MKKRRVLRKTWAVSALALFFVLQSAAVFALPPPPPPPQPEYLPPAETTDQVYVSFQSLYNEKYVRVVNGCGDNVKADRYAPGCFVDKIFIMNGSSGLQDGTTVNIRTACDDCYFIARPDGDLDANSYNRDAWETFELINLTRDGDLQNGDIVGFKSVHGKYVRVNKDTLGLDARHNLLNDPWEKFRVVFQPETEKGCETGLEGKYYVTEIDPATGKKLIHVEGTPYERGFAIGYEFPEETIRNCSNEYYNAVLKRMVGDWIEPWTNLAPVVCFVKEAVLQATKVHQCNIPDEYMVEMEGIVDGVNRALPDADFEFDDILMLNLSIDVIKSIQGDIFNFLGIPESLLYTSCNGFVATADATSDGRTIMGRHYMFPAEVFHETCLIIEYVPDKGYPFVSITPPGYVGATTAMNNQGIGIGQYVLRGAPTNYWLTGMGRLMLTRDVAQLAGSLDQAVDILRYADIADGNMFVIGDGAGDGAIVECHAEAFAVRYMDSTYDSADYDDPDNQQQQIEDKDDLVLVANHAVVPGIANNSSGKDDSLRRYDELCGLLLGSYGSLDISNGRNIIDFMHPPGWYYGNDIHQPVAASVTLFDLTNLELWSLYGRYSDTWVNHRLNY